MRITWRALGPIVAGWVAWLLAAQAWTAAGEGRGTWTIERGEVRVICPMTVGGSFEATTTSLAGSLVRTSSRPPSYAGALSVKLGTLDTGIALRNDHLRERYLEVGKGAGFEHAVLSDVDLPDIDPDTFKGAARFTGTLLLHGTKKSIGGRAEIRRTPSSVEVTASFPVTLADFGIAKPQYLGIGVKSQVQVKVAFTAKLAAETAADFDLQGTFEIRR